MSVAAFDNRVTARSASAIRSFRAACNGWDGGARIGRVQRRGLGILTALTQPAPPLCAPRSRAVAA